MEKDTTIEGVMKKLDKLVEKYGHIEFYLKPELEVRNLIREALSAQKEEIEKGVRSNIGMLRQWLNEKDRDLTVTNKMIETFLFPITSNKENK